MIISEIAKPITAEMLNENLAQKFGKRINLEQFTLEQLQDARNKIRTTLSQVETNESFDSVNSDNYRKSKMYLDVLNQAIIEREAIEEKAKPDYLDMDKDGDKKEPMKKAIKDKKKVKEGKEDEAELTMAAKDMVDRVTGWMEDTAEMQTESMLELADAIRDEMGSEASEAFVNVVKPALESLYATMETTREALTSGVGQLTGEGGPMDTMGADDGMDMDMEPTTDMDGGDDMGDIDPADDEVADTVDDDFGADAAAAGGEEEAGRPKRESVERSKKKSMKA